MVGLPLHLWTLKILKKIGDACGRFLALDKVTTLRTEVMWAKMLIKLVGKSRPTAANILEGSRSFELQIWWETPPWLPKVYPTSSNAEAKIPKEEDDGGARAALHVGVSHPRSNDGGQKGQENVSKNGRRKGLVGVEIFKSKSEDERKFKGGIHTSCWGSKVVGSNPSECGLDQQASSTNGTSNGDVSFSRLNGPKQLRPM